MCLISQPALFAKPNRSSEKEFLFWGCRKLSPVTPQYVQWTTLTYNVTISNVKENDIGLEKVENGDDVKNFSPKSNVVRFEFQHHGLD